MADLTTQLGALVLRNPVITASGTFGYGREYAGLVPFDQLGAITVKGVSPFPCDGNPMPRATEVFGGMLNAIGLQNPGIDRFIADSHYLPYLRTLPCPVIVNVWGRTVEQYADVARRLEAERDGVAALEINISCPNVKEGGIAFGTDCRAAASVVSAVRVATTLAYTLNVDADTELFAKFISRGSAAVSVGTEGGAEFRLNGAGEALTSYNEEVRLGTTVTFTAVDPDSVLHWENASGKISARARR